MLLVSLFISSLTLFAVAGSQRSDEFENPSAEYRPKFRYWLPDASISSEIIAQDFRNVKAAGAGGVEYVPFYLYGLPAEIPGVGTPTDWNKYGFGTSAYISQFRDALKAANESGIILDFALGANQGQGVPAEPLTPGLAVQLLMGNATILPGQYFSEKVPIPQYPPETISSGLGFMHPLQFFGEQRLIAAIAYEVAEQRSQNITWNRQIYLKRSSFIDLTAKVADGVMQWMPPDTNTTWKIFTFWEAYTNQKSCTGGKNSFDFIGNGSWITDHFSKTGAQLVTDFWDQYMLSDAEIRHLLGSVGKYAWEDSMEMLAVLYWTPGLLERFKDSQKYDLAPYLPMIFNPSNTWNGLLPMYSERYGFDDEPEPGMGDYQLDYRKVLNDGYQEYLAHFKDWTHSFGTQYSAQVAYNLPLQMFSDIPLVDAPEGESLGFGQLTDAYRQFTGPAHLSNHSVVSTELGAVNIAPYTMRVPDLLQQIKRSFAGGFTMNVIHGFPATAPYFNTTWPGYTTFYYMFTDMWNTVQPAWQHLKDAMDYISRNQLILQHGSPRMDLAFYSYASPWYPRPQYNSTNLRDLGYTYDYLGPDNLVGEHAIVHGHLLGSPAYKALIFNNQTVITIAVVHRVTEMALSGLPIIFIGQPPNRTYPATRANQAALAVGMERLLSTKNVYHFGSVEELPSVLARLKIDPRVSLTCTTNPVYPVLRSSEDRDYLFFFNDNDVATKCSAKIAAAGAEPYIYDAWTGGKLPFLQYTTTGSTLNAQFNFQPNETMILALHRGSDRTQCLITSSSGALHSLISKSGRLFATITGPTLLQTSSGKQWNLKPHNAAPTNLTTWDLVIEDWHSSPDNYAIKTDIRNHTFNAISLKPWNRISPSLESVSGVGHYYSSFHTPSIPSNETLAAILHLPPTQHTARAFLDGRMLNPIDPANPTIDLTGLVVGGSEYSIRVDITTTLFNRIKSEADNILIVGNSAGALQPLYKSMAPEGYGLVGRVWLEWGVVVEVAC